MRRTVLVLIVFAGFSLAALAQATSRIQHSEFSAQVTGVFTQNTNNIAANHLVTESAGLLIGYRFHINSWEGVEIEYGYTRNGQRYFTPPTAPGGTGASYAVTANMQDVVANEVIMTPRLFGFFQPFLLAGGGLVFFTPRSGTTIAAQRQDRGAINYGGGMDFHIGHIGARIEFQALNFKIPDFKNPALTVNKWTRVAQPSAGLVFTF